MRSSLQKLVAVGFGLGLLTAPLSAQDRGKGGVVVPDGYEPPRGMCRIWIEGVPAGQQPAPTDCATAIKKRPANAVVVFGEPVRSLDEAERVRERLPTSELWTPRRGLAPSRSGSNSEARSREETPTRRGAEPTPRTRTEPAPKRAETQAPRSRTEPASTPPPAARKAPPPPPPSSGEERGRVRPPPTPPPGYTQDLLARERWLDEDLLASYPGHSRPMDVR